ncbi:MAG TPA: hypothetical protein VJ733_05075 [Candidatus Binatia bacterium]|nr:hypothetical protein [Candidatus Binatia bacterium]
MTRKSRQSLVDEAIGLLVKHFGVDRVRAALAKASSGAVGAFEGQPRRGLRRPDLQASPTVTSMLEQIRQKDEEKYRLLAGFYAQLKDRRVLPESQDIRHFAQLIGLKEISGKSRKDMVPRLMRFLLDQPTERVQVHIETAPNVSEQQRQKGFSVLTDKLLGQKPE